MVCTGNICRSPTAQGFLLKALQDHALDNFVQVDSAGTTAIHEGSPPDPRSIDAAKAHGIDLSVFRARSIKPEDFERFDLIVAMDGSNLMNLRDMAPAQGRAELVLLLDYLPNQPLRDVPDPLSHELHTKRFFVHRFQVAWPKLTMHRDRRPVHTMG